MIIEKIEFKNILSFGGNKTFVIANKPGIDMIIAENGIGKSNIAKIIKMAYYFDYPSKLEHIVNYDQKDGVIRTHTITKGDKYICTYNFNRKKLKNVVVEKNGSVVDTGNTSSTKRYILEHITDIPKDVMYNIFIPSIDTFKSFIGMSPDDTRKIRDELFSLTSINEKSKKVKDKLSDLNSNKMVLESNIDVLLSSIDNDKIALQETKRSIDKDLDEKRKKENKNRQIQISKNHIIDSELLRKEKDIEHINSVLSDFGELEKRKGREVLLGKLEKKELEKKELEKKLDELLDYENRLKLHKNYLEKTRLEGVIVNNNKLLVSANDNLSNKLDELKKLNHDRDTLFYRHKSNLISSLELELAPIENELETKNNKLSTLYEQLLKLKNIIESKIETIKILRLGDECPTCHSKLEYDEKLLLGDENELKTLKHEYKHLKSEYDNLKDETKKLKNEVNLKTKDIESHRFELSKYSDGDLFFDFMLLDECDTKIEETNSNINELNGIIENIEFEINNAESKISIIDGVGWSSEVVETKNDINDINDINNKIDIINHEIKDIESEIAILQTNDKEIKLPKEPKEYYIKKLSDDLEELKKLKKEKEDIKNELISINERLEILNKKDDGVAIKSMEKSIKSKEKQLKEKQTALDSIVCKINDYEMLRYVYSENGVKKWILNQIRTSFSASINKMLIEFDLSVEFDDGFSMIVYKGGRELPQKLMSVGQKKIVDTVMCLNFIDIYKMKLPELNFIMLDESLSSLSRKNTDLLLGIISNKLNNGKFNIKITNHAPVDNNIIDNTIKLVDMYGYTHIE